MQYEWGSIQTPDGGWEEHLVMHSARMRMGTAMAVAMAMSASCGTHRLSGGNGDAGSGDGGMARRTNPPPGGFGATGGSDDTGGAPGSGGSGTPGDPLVPPPSALPISPREALTRLARVLWEAPPDPWMLQLADSGAVVTDQDVRQIATTMLGDPRARVGVGHFYRWWLGLDALPSVTKDPSLFPEYSPAVGALMAKETETFGVYTTLDGDGIFATLMQGSYSFINETLAPFYGVAGVTGADLQKVDLDPTQRAGIFTQLSMLTLNSGYDGWTAPSMRGTAVVNSALCLNVPREPPGSPAVEPDPRYTNRELINRQVSSSNCASCHRYFDPVGFAYEGFDSVGRVRSTDAGKPIDSSGDVVLGPRQVQFAGPVELAHILTAAPEAAECMTRKWLEYMLGRGLTSDDMLSWGAITARFEDSNLDLRTAIAAATSSASFLRPGGGTPCTPGGSDLQFGSESFVVARNLRTRRQMHLQGRLHVGRLDRPLPLDHPGDFSDFAEAPRR
jgi:hypothetical protein